MDFFRPFFLYKVVVDIKAVPSGIEKKFYDLCREVVEQEGLHLYDLIYGSGQMALRLFIMDEKTGSAVLDDCMKIDRALTPYIDDLDWMPTQLNLEVSSPGVYRSLKRLEHFEKVLGADILLNMNKKYEEPGLPDEIMGHKKFVATLVSATEERIELKINKQHFNIFYNDIKKASVEHWPEELTPEV